MNLTSASKIIVTGFRGQLGFECVRELKERGFSNVLGIDIDELDITNETAVRTFVSRQKPAVIMHNAAWTAVDKAEEFEEKAFLVNATGTKFLAEAAKDVEATMVYISTDYVFPGKGRRFYEVDDATGPSTVYGKTKLQGEEFVKQILDHFFIVRVSWVFGKNGRNFVNTMLKLADTPNRIAVVDDQIGSPTYAYDLAKLLCDMIATEKYGTYHATNEGVCSWYEFATEIFRQIGKKVEIVPVTTAEYMRQKPNQAIRPLNSRLSKEKILLAGFHKLPRWQDALNRYLKEIGALK